MNELKFYFRDDKPKEMKNQEIKYSFRNEKREDK